MASDVPNFIRGRQLKALFFQEVVRPILDRRFPNLRYSRRLSGRAPMCSARFRYARPIMDGDRDCSFFCRRPRLKHSSR